jgi:hypothetical protein
VSVEVLNSIGQFVLDAAIVVLNGLLVMAYGVWDRLPNLLALAGAGIILVFDRQVAFHNLSRPARQERDRIEPTGLRSRIPQVLTAVIGVIWLAAAWVYPQPVPEIGAAMWWGWIGALLFLRGERDAILWRGKGFLLTYALALLGFRVYLSMAARFEPSAWAAVLGSSGEAQRVIAGNLAIFATIGTWLTWFVLPVAHFSYLVQRLLVNPLSLAAPFATAEEWIAALRGRSGD